LPIRVRDRLAEVFADEPFTGAFGVRGAPGMAPAVLSLVTVLQFAENLTDRQAAAMAVRAIDWKYAIGAELTDTGFDPSVLARFRARLAEHGLERVVFDRLVDHCRDAGLVGAGGKQRADATHVVSGVRDLNRLELAGESVRTVLEALAVAAPAWLAGQIDVAEFAYRYGPRVNGWSMPSSTTKRDRLAQVFAQDGYAIVRAVYDAAAPMWVRDVEAVQILRQVLVQTYCVRTDTRGRDVIVKRDADDEGVPPGRCRLASPYDTDARWAAKGEDGIAPDTAADLLREKEQLERAMESRPVVDMACGVLMAGFACQPEDAREILVTVSQHTDIRLREVAEAVTGAAAGTPMPPELQEHLSGAVQTRRAGPENGSSG
jgi:transposase